MTCVLQKAKTCRVTDRNMVGSFRVSKLPVLYAAMPYRSWMLRIEHNMKRMNLPGEFAAR